MANAFQNFLAGRELANNERQNQIQNQLLTAQQQTQEGELALKQAAAAREQQFNRLLPEYLGNEPVSVLGFPRQQQAAPQGSYPLPTGDVDPYGGQQSGESPIFSQLVGLDPKRALEVQGERQKRAQATQRQIYDLATRTLSSKSPAATFKYLLNADQIGDLNTKQFREQLSQQGIDVDSLDDAGASELLQLIADQAGIAAGVQPATDDLKEYQVARSQGETRNFSDWLTAMKRAGSSNTNVNLPGYERTFTAKLAEADAKRIEKYQQEADGATRLRDTISQLSDLNESALEGGTAERRLAVANFIQGLTGIDAIDPKVLANSQVFNALANKAVLDSLGGSLGSGVSNADVAFFKSTIPQLEYSAKARQDLLKRLDDIAQKKISLYEESRAYAEEKGGLKGFRSGAGNKAAPKKDYSGMSNDDLKKELGLERR